ncbi:MAG: M15 family metallopeptidase, partial [Polyangiaceae bacterium]|nr:M15 family metallopeptidase [Polyangiaceae bacterium]
MTEYRSTIGPIDEGRKVRMRGRSWHDDPRCPPFDSLRLVRIAHYGFDGLVHEGELVVASFIAEETARIFGRLFGARFPIERMTPVDAFDGDDDASMAANNTSAFNFREILGKRGLSHHAYGVAIDLNPRLNPMLVDGAVHPPSGAEFLDREDVRPGMIVRPGPV